jgi:DNA-binding response OmpR family regulator
MSTLRTETTPPVSGATAALIVDAEPRNVYELSMAFRAAGYRTLSATSFADARRLLIAEQPEVLVTDVRLGDFNGIQLLVLAREIRPGISAVITNIAVDSVLAQETHRLGGTFMVKPLDVRDVLNAVHNQSRRWAGSNRSDMDRRVAVTPDFHPERRVVDGRLTPAVDRRAAERRTMPIPNVFPERRESERRRATQG